MEYAFKKHYAGKRVLVTGHTGFKGSWLCIWLKELGAEVMGYALAPPSEPNNFAVCRLDEKIGHVLGDVRDMDALRRVFDDFRPEIVFHLAAQALVRYSYEVPKETLETNVLGTVNLLETVRLSPSVNTLVLVTSDKCYENREQVWGYKENDPMGGDDPYSASKGAAEIIFRSHLLSFLSHRKGFGGVTVRAGNVIGGGDWGRDRIVPDCIKSLIAGETITVRSPMAIRPWQHVLEPLSGYLWLGARLSEDVQRFSGGWNFGPADSSAKCVSDLVEALLREWKSGNWEDVSERNDRRLHEAGWLRLNCDKAHFMLPWSAILGFDDTICMTVKWYKYQADFPETNMYQYCVHQIHEYTRRASGMGQMWAE
jgi:CDP-glucose 4,6-dehydratase